MYIIDVKSKIYKQNGQGWPRHCKYVNFNIHIKSLMVVEEEGQRRDGGLWIHEWGSDSGIQLISLRLIHLNQVIKPWLRANACFD